MIETLLGDHLGQPGAKPTATVESDRSSAWLTSWLTTGQPGAKATRVEPVTWVEHAAAEVFRDSQPAPCGSRASTHFRVSWGSFAMVFLRSIPSQVLRGPGTDSSSATPALIRIRGSRRCYSTALCWPISPAYLLWPNEPFYFIRRRFLPSPDRNPGGRR